MRLPIYRSSTVLWMVLALALAGCFTSKFTLIPAEQAKVDRAYVGDWDAANSKGEHVLMVIRNIDDKQYYIEIREKDNPKTDRYVGFIAGVKDATFAHVRPLKDDGVLPDEWILLRIQLADGVMTLRQLDDKFFADKPLASAEQLRQVLEQNLDNQAMYAKDETITAKRVTEK